MRLVDLALVGTFEPGFMRRQRQRCQHFVTPTEARTAAAWLGFERGDAMARLEAWEARRAVAARARDARVAAAQGPARAAALVGPR